MTFIIYLGIFIAIGWPTNTQDQIFGQLAFLGGLLMLSLANLKGRKQ